jgi:hypothetical protein
MRRARIFLGIVAVVLLPATSVSAQTGPRDPFDPLLTAEDPTDSTDPVAPTVDPTTAPDPNPPATDGLPTTGRDPHNWVGIAYALVAIGTALVAYSHAMYPRARRRSLLS